MNERLHVMWGFDGVIVKILPRAVHKKISAMQELHTAPTGGDSKEAHRLETFRHIFGEKSFVPHDSVVWARPKLVEAMDALSATGCISHVLWCPATSHRDIHAVLSGIPSLRGKFEFVLSAECFREYPKQHRVKSNVKTCLSDDEINLFQGFQVMTKRKSLKDMIPQLEHQVSSNLKCGCRLRHLPSLRRTVVVDHMGSISSQASSDNLIHIRMFDIFQPGEFANRTKMKCYPRILMSSGESGTELPVMAQFIIDKLFPLADVRECLPFLLM
ncbi:hypothetical protein XU18_5069 [Perkinsela sp. CCAP 1560/4]|nr:hypothetical protein XU18_5069 [Perkinsela sp. CCAP 1560/4]|eukprot:KNH02447.1 hypothetical protein XU18_5069 [Perkinsela sp. CCAP 1560/4]